MSTDYQTRVKDLYNEKYTIEYSSMYGPKMNKLKHFVNKAKIDKLLPSNGKWLDVCCGEAWHFSVCKKGSEKVGIDISEHQIERAKKKNPTCKFICDDVIDVKIENDYFDLVTSFWGGYCYFPTFNLIEKFFTKIIDSTKTGGNVYVDIIPPPIYFNESEYSEILNTTLTFDKSNKERWVYHDSGGDHYMLSPSIESIFKIFEGKFKSYEFKNTDLLGQHAFENFIAKSKI
jgi:ubiquinone/menaquinone biosynthesis C-methylase UbiE